MKTVLDETLTKISIAIFALLACNISPAFAEMTMTETQPIAGDSFRDYRIEGCNGVNGTGMYSYRPSSADNSLPIYDYIMSDFCLDLKSGSFFAYEPTEGLTLVRGSDELPIGAGGSSFELLNQSDEVRLAHSISPMPSNFLCSSGKSGSYYVQQNLPEKYIAREGNWSGANFFGFNAGEPYGDKNIPQKDNYGFWVKAISTDKHKRVDYRPTEDSVGEMISFGFFGTATNENGTQILEIKNGDTVSSGVARGQIKVAKQPNGKIELSGTFHVETARIAGLKPVEWVSATGKIDHMRGLISGKDGSAAYAVGVASGSFTDARGEIHSVRFKIGMNTCGAANTPIFSFP